MVLFGASFAPRIFGVGDMARPRLRCEKAASLLRSRHTDLWRYSETTCVHRSTFCAVGTALAFYGGAHHVPGQHRFRDRGTPVVTNCASRERHRCSIFDRRPAGRWDEARNGGVHEVTRSRTRNRSRIARFMPLRTTSHSADEDVSVGAENREDLDVMEGASEEREGQEDEDRDVVEISEEELMQEWADRGLDPAAFDPRVLLQLWESEDDEVRHSISVYPPEAVST